VTIRLRVSGQRDRAVELVRNLEHSRRFLQPRLASETAETTTTGNQASFQPASGTTNVSFDVLAGYNPLLPESKEGAKTGKGEKGEKEADSDGGKTQSPAPAAPKKTAPKRLVPKAPLRPMAPARPAKGAQ
jgi:type IV pilus assembly protein PilN